MSEGELLWHGDAGLEIRLSHEPTPAVLDLLERTVWGSRRLRYRIRGVAGKLARMVGPHFLTLERGGDLLAVCVLNRRESRLLGAPVDSFHFAIIATEPAMAGQGHAGVLAEQAAAGGAQVDVRSLSAHRMAGNDGYGRPQELHYEAP